MDSEAVASDSAPVPPVTGTPSDAKFSFVNVIDDRVHDNGKNLYPIIKGNSSNNYVFVSATSATQASLTFQSPNIQPSFYIDRQLMIKGTMVFNLSMQATTNVANATKEQYRILVPGVDISPCALPFSESVALCSTIINDATIATSYVSDQKDLLLHMSDYKRNMPSMACPSCPDYATSYQDAYLTPLNNCGNVNDMSPFAGFIPNAVFPIEYYYSTAGAAGAADAAIGWYSKPPLLNRVTPAGDLAANTPFTVQIRIPINEPVLSAPWIYNTSKEFKNIGLTGVKNFSLNFTMNTGARAIRYVQTSRTIAGASGAANTVFQLLGMPMFDPMGAFGSGAFVKPQLCYTMLSAPESFAIERPLKARIPIVNVERNLKNVGAIAAGARVPLLSDVINLTRIPYLIAVGVKPQQYASGGTGDWLFALQEGNPINITFNNTPGKMSTYTKQQLFNVARSHGLQSDYIIWSGGSLPRFNAAAVGAGADGFGTILGAGGWVLIQPCIDFDTGDISLSPGSACNLAMQISLLVQNQTAADVAAANMFVFCLYNDWIETDTVAQKSEVLTSIVDASAVLRADTVAPSASQNELFHNYLGGGTLHNHERGHRKHHKKIHKKYYLKTARGGKVIGGSMKSSSRMPKRF